MHSSLPSVCGAVCKELSLSSVLCFQHWVNCCGVWTFQQHTVGKVSCQKHACPQLIRQSRGFDSLNTLPVAVESALLQWRKGKKIKKWQEGNKPRLELKQVPECPGTASLLPPGSLQELGRLPPLLHSHTLLGHLCLCSEVVCIHAFTPDQDVLCVYTSVYMQVCKSLYGCPEAV